MKKLCIAAACMTLLALSAHTLSIKNKSLELEIHERSGRFSLYSLLGGDAKVSLLVEEDPRTTILTVLAGSKIYRMGDSFEFSQEITQSSDSAEIVWQNASLKIIQRFELNDAAVLLKVSIENKSEQNLQIGIRYLLDTYLGERTTHYRADGLSVSSETDYIQTTPEEIVSSDGKDNTLRIVLAGTGITEPDEVILANWKRLNDATWTFESNQKRGFNLLPYSINDSAVALYYEPQNVPSKSIRAISFLLAAKEATRTPSSTAVGSAVDKVNNELKSALIVETQNIDVLLTRIDQLLDAALPPASSDIEAIKSTLDQLERKKDELSERK